MSDQRTGYIQGLRALADILEHNPGIPLPLHGDAEHTALLIGFYGSDGREKLAAAARAFPCTWAKDADGKWFNLNGVLGGGLHVQLYAEREQVCTRRVVGVEDREVEEVVTPAVTRKVTKPVEVVEWDCGPLLAPRGKPPYTTVEVEDTLPDYQQPPGVVTSERPGNSYADEAPPCIATHETDGGSIYTCLAAKGHTGYHMAYGSPDENGDHEVCFSWPQKPAPALPPDVSGDLDAIPANRIGDPAPTADEVTATDHGAITPVHPPAATS